jgi:hypothetical protein
MTDDKFFERLREEAAKLRYTPQDEFTWTRLTARIRNRLRSDATVAQMLARWFRPITASFAMLAIVAALSITWIETREPAYNADSISSNSLEISVDGDTYTIAE